MCVYLYDEGGSPIGMQYTNADGSWYTFWFEKNLHGDILGVYDTNGNKLIGYTYDSWGRHSTERYATGFLATVAASNPFRYRGYYYDADLNLYLLGTRYYDPEIRRFISADSYISTGQGILGYNMYAYCGNNPIMRVDYSGEFWHIVAGAVVGVGSQYIADVIYNITFGETGLNILKPSSSFVDYIASGVSGAVASTGIGIIGARVANVAIDGTAYLLSHAINGEEINNIELLFTVIISAATSEKGINGANLRGVYKRSKEVLETALSPKKIAMYTAKISNIKSTVIKKIYKYVEGDALLSAIKALIDRNN